jgi:Ca2+-binding EF-hand superfamily protein
MERAWVAFGNPTRNKEATMRSAAFTYLSLTMLSAVGLLACADSQPDTEYEQPAGEDELLEEEPQAEVDVVFSEYDANRDTYLTEDEWPLWWEDADLLVLWDLDGEARLNAAEVSAAAVELWDTDRDGGIAEAEWTEGCGLWFGVDAECGTFPVWDVSADGSLGTDEIASGLETNGLFADLDTNQDGLVDSEELGDRFFRIVDLDDDARVDVDEWNRGVEYGYTR